MCATTRKTRIASLTKAELATFTEWRCSGCQRLFGSYRGEDVYIGEDIYAHSTVAAPIMVKCLRCNIESTYCALSKGRSNQSDCKAPNKGKPQGRGLRS